MSQPIEIVDKIDEGKILVIIDKFAHNSAAFVELSIMHPLQATVERDDIMRANKAFTDEEISLMKQWKLSEIIYKIPESDTGMFSITKTGVSNTEITFSSRHSTEYELRGKHLREILAEYKKSNDNMTLYDALALEVKKPNASVMPFITALSSAVSPEGQLNKIISDKLFPAFNALANACIKYGEECKKAGVGANKLEEYLQSFIKDNAENIIRSAFHGSPLTSEELYCELLVRKQSVLKLPENMKASNIQSALIWIKSVHSLEAECSQEDRAKIRAVIDTAGKLLVNSISGNDEQKKTASTAFKNAIDAVQDLEGNIEVLRWPNVHKFFLKYLPIVAELFAEKKLVWISNAIDHLNRTAPEMLKTTPRM